MSSDVSVPEPRDPEREVGIRELRNAGKILAELSAAGQTGRVTSGGHLVGWLVPASDEERRVEELVAGGVLVPPRRRGGLAGRRPLPRRTDVPPLSEALEHLRESEDR
ncbi:MAG: hypothetical protein L0I76_19670 [Pseudonocardia sp.]|nr:hypothetical protein [Pseudonocardia sp.]